MAEQTNIEKMSANEIRLLEYIYDNYNDFPDQNQIAAATRLSIYQVSRYVDHYENIGYIKRTRFGRHQSWKPGKNKKFEVLSLLRVYKICKREIESEQKNILRIHDIEYYFKSLVPSNYDKSLFIKRYPAGNRVVLLIRNALFTAEIHLKTLDSTDNTAQIFPEPFFMVVPLSIIENELREAISLECAKRLKVMEEMLAENGILLGEQIKISPGEIAMSNSWNVQLGIKEGLYNRHLDDSLKNGYGEEEYDYEDAVKIIPASLAIQDFCATNNIDRSQFSNMFVNYHDKVGSPIPMKPQYYFSRDLIKKNIGSPAL